MTVTWKSHMKWIEPLFLHDSFPVCYMTWLIMENICYIPKEVSIVIKLWLQVASTIHFGIYLNNDCDMEGSHEMSEAILFAWFFFCYYMKWLEMEKTFHKPKKVIVSNQVMVLSSLSNSFWKLF